MINAARQLLTVGGEEGGRLEARSEDGRDRVALAGGRVSTASPRAGRRRWRRQVGATAVAMAVGLAGCTYPPPDVSGVVAEWVHDGRGGMVSLSVTASGKVTFVDVPRGVIYSGAYADDRYDWNDLLTVTGSWEPRSDVLSGLPALSVELDPIVEGGATEFPGSGFPMSFSVGQEASSDSMVIFISTVDDITFEFRRAE